MTLKEFVEILNEEEINEGLKYFKASKQFFFTIKKLEKNADVNPALEGKVKNVVQKYKKIYTKIKEAEDKFRSGEFSRNEAKTEIKDQVDDLKDIVKYVKTNFNNKQVKETKILKPTEYFLKKTLFFLKSAGWGFVFGPILGGLFAYFTKGPSAARKAIGTAVSLTGLAYGVTAVIMLGGLEELEGILDKVPKPNFDDDATQVVPKPDHSSSPI